MTTDKQDIMAGFTELEQAWQEAMSAYRQFQACSSYENWQAMRQASAKHGQAFQSLQKQVAAAKRRRHVRRPHG